MNAIELLKADHEKVATLFAQFKKNEDGDNKSLFEKVKAELDVHTHIEETIFYPALQAKDVEELTSIVLEGIEEHHQVKMFLKELHSLSEDSEKFNAKFKVLVEDVEHHVKEEEGEMFPLTKKQFDANALDALGAKMEAEKANFKKSQAASA